MVTGIIEMDVHGLTAAQARGRIDTALARATGAVYRIHVIHGYHHGTGIKSMLLEEYGYGRSDKVLRISNGANPGITELVLREF